MKRGYATALSVLSVLLVLAATRVRGDVVPADWIGEGNTADAEFGTEVAAGDYNGDGFIDVLVGSYTYTNVEVQEGASYIFFGTPTGISTKPGWIWESNVESQHSGRTVANVGDLNGDGIDDIVISGPSTPNGPVAAIFLFYGSPQGPRRTPDWEHFSHLHNDRFGRSVDRAGDVNGDGYDDMIIGGYYWDGPEVDEGSVWVIHGSAKGIPQPTECSQCHGGGAMWRAESNQAGASMGWGSAGAGDVNGDGYDDVIVGAPGFSVAHETPTGRKMETVGAAFVYLGSANGLSQTPQAILPSPDTGSRFGRTVSSAGDVNGDGYSDVIVGARRYDRDSRQLKEGAALVYHGSPSGILPEPAWVAVGTEPQGLFGHAVSRAGDINGDGYSDVVVGEQLAFSEETDISSPAETANRSGRVHVYLGSKTGLSPTPAWILDGDRIQGDFGVWLEPAGDIDRDSRGDLLIGAWRYDNDQENEGRVFLYYGATLMAMGTKEPHRGVAGDYDGDGRSDLLWTHTTGHLALSLTNTTEVMRTELLEVTGNAWRFAATGDFNGDGKADVIQQNVLDGRARMVFVDGNIVVSTHEIPGVDSKLRAKASGDFNKDGRDDVLWYNTSSRTFHITLMDGSLVLSKIELSGVSDPEEVLRVGGVGDFDGDGTDDIIWNDTQSGDVAVTLIQDLKLVHQRRLYNSAELPLKIAGVGDFTEDRKADVILWDESTRELHLVKMDGSLATGVDMLAHVAQPWEPSLGYFDDDHRPDILWRDRASGEMVVWFMDGLQVRASTVVGSGPGTGWRFVNVAQFCAAGC